MSSQTEVTQRQNAASPLAQDIIQILRGQLRSGGGRMTGGSRGGTGGGGQTVRTGSPLSPGAQQEVSGSFGGTPRGPQEIQGALDANALGTGVGPLQREAGTAIRQFLDAGQRLPDAHRQAILDVQANQRERALGDLGERMSLSGIELGTPGQVGKARLLSELVPRQTAQLFEEERARGDQLLRAIMGMHTIGQRNLEPFLRLASQGLFAPNVAQKEHPLVTTAGALSGLGRGAGEVIPVI